MSTPYSFAISFVLLEGLTQNPKMMAFEACANTTSLSVIVPIPLLITLTLTPATSIFSRAPLTASSEPLTSAFKITLISWVPESIDANKLSNDNDCFWKLFSRAWILLFSAIYLACDSVSKAMNLSPAAGVADNPVISTGVDGPASTIEAPISFFIVLTLP